MTVAYHLRGYDKTTEFVGVEFDIPVKLLRLVKSLLPDIDVDPDLFDPHAIACDQVARLADELNVSLDPTAFDFYIESDEDWRIARDRREPARARA
jgi:hypothetical protein